MKKEIKINGVTYTLRNSLRNYFIFEEIVKRTFNVNKTFDWIALFYSTLLANNESFNMEFDGFVSLCDEHPELFAEFQQFIIDVSKIDAQRTANNDVKKKMNPKRKK
jgi:hypothetical protein|nr:MAG TPA: Paired amphipathic helix protein [Caudoviricetes sp.]